MTSNKRKVKNIIIRAFKGGLTKTETENIRKNLMNYSLAEWRDLIKVSKELAKEKADEEIQKLPEKDLPSD